MEFERTSNGILEFTFHGAEEVDTVQAAFEERNERLEANGNHSSVSKHDNWVSNWSGVVETFRCTKPDELLKALDDFVENTEEEVDTILDEEDSHERIEIAGYRYELASYASGLLELISFNISASQNPREAHDE